MGEMKNNKRNKIKRVVAAAVCCNLWLEKIIEFFEMLRLSVNDCLFRIY